MFFKKKKWEVIFRVKIVNQRYLDEMLETTGDEIYSASHIKEKFTVVTRTRTGAIIEAFKSAKIAEVFYGKAVEYLLSFPTIKKLSG